MIRRLDHFNNLAIIGMSVITPDAGDINEFGRLVYHDLPLTGHFNESFPRETAISRGISKVCDLTPHQISKKTVINLSPSITGILQNDFPGNRIIEVTGISPALTLASDLLEKGEVETILLVELHEDPQLFCSLLVTGHEYALDNKKSVLALMVGAAEADGPLTRSVVSGVLEEARRTSDLKIGSIGLVLTATLNVTGLQNEETEGLLGAFDSLPSLSCALDKSLGGLLGMVKSVWCLSRRVIPGVSDWCGPTEQNKWNSSPFYVPTESRAWFLRAGEDARFAGVNFLSDSGCFTHLLFCDTATSYIQVIDAPRQESLHLFPFTGGSAQQLLENMGNLKTKLRGESDMSALALDTHRQYIKEKTTSSYVVCLLSQTFDEFIHEMDFAAKGIPIAIEKQSDWQTPMGSFFTPHPLGKEGNISFVYPGAFNSYPGVGRDLFYLYPNLFQHLNGMTDDVGSLLNQSLLYPRSIKALNMGELVDIEAQLTSDPITMLISGSCLAVLYTDVLRNVFEIHPRSAFGYSLGEVSMMFASRVWTDADATSRSLRESPLFHTRLTGPQNAVREFWNLPPGPESNPQETLWKNYLLMTEPEKVKESLPSEPHVYLTHINTPHQVAIGGDPAGCRRLIEKIRCKSLQAPFNYAIHCEPIKSEFEMLTDLHSVPVKNKPDMVLFSAATYERMPFDRQSIAQHIAQELCNCLDFPRLINLAYNDGARIFIELGAGSNCARWVNETLQGKPHGSYSINRKGVDDHTSILRLLARLVSHQTPVNLKVLYQD